MSLMINIGRAGAQTFQQQINNSGHNIANSTTTGFQRTFNQIQDLSYFNQTIPSDTFLQGVGSRLGTTQSDFRQGSLMQTGGETHFAVNGNGFFGVMNPVTNQVELTRNGTFGINAAGELTDQNGNLVMMRTVVGADGVARQEPALFRPTESHAQLTRMSNGLFQIDPDDLISNMEGDDGIFGAVQAGSLESSNVDLGEEMTNLMISQRAYSMNMRIIQNADETKQIVNNLR